MRIWSLCLWLLLMSPSLAYTQTEGDSGGTGTTGDPRPTEGTKPTEGTNPTEEEPDCDD